MANINTATNYPRMISGTTINIGSDVLLAKVDSGLNEIEFGFTEKHPQWEGDEVDAFTEGKRRPSIIPIKGYFTSTFTSDTILAKFRPATASGEIPFIAITIVIPIYKGATGSNTGMSFAFTKCILRDGFKITPGTDSDMWEAVMESWGAVPTPSLVTIS